MYDVIDVAKYVIYKYNTFEIKGISNLKLQKVLYLIQANFLIETNEPCFYSRIEAWDFGPVIPEVYRKYKRYAGMTILDKIEDDFSFTTKDKRLINDVINLCYTYSSTALVKLTQQQTPWKDAFKHGAGTPITTKAIKKFFK